MPWWDALPTAVSVVGQFLLGRKYVENWAVWIAVNVVSVGLFAYKGLWLTVRAVRAVHRAVAWSAGAPGDGAPWQRTAHAPMADAAA